MAHKRVEIEAVYNRLSPEAVGRYVLALIALARQLQAEQTAGTDGQEEEPGDGC